eukprot:g42005.t1
MAAKKNNNKKQAKELIAKWQVPRTECQLLHQCLRTLPPGVHVELGPLGTVKCANAMEKPGYVCLGSDGMDMTKTTLSRISKDSSGGLVYKCTGVKCHGNKHPSRLFFSCMHKSDSNLHLQYKEDADKEEQSEAENQAYNGGAVDSSQDSALEASRTSDTEETESQTSSRQHAVKDIPKDGKVGGAGDSNSTSLDAGQTSDHDARKQASTQNTDGKDIPKDADCMESKTAEEARTPFMHGFLQLDNTSKDNKNISSYSPS